MKASRILCVCAAVALPQLSMAQQAPNSQSLGMVLAILHFCTAVDPRDAAAFRAQERNLLAGVSVSALASVKGSNAVRAPAEVAMPLPPLNCSQQV